MSPMGDSHQVVSCLQQFAPGLNEWSLPLVIVVVHACITTWPSPIFVSPSPQPHSMLQWVLEKLVMLMVAYFILSIINSMAQAYAKHLDEEKNRPQPEYKTD